MGFWDKLFRGKSDTTDLIKAAPKGKAPIPQSYEIDPLEYSLAGLANAASGREDYQGHAGSTGVGYNVLRSMARVPVIAAIVNTRVNQLAEFALPQSDPYSLGFQISLRDPEQEMTKGSRKKAREMMNWLQTCGDPRVTPGLTFEAFLRQIMRDSLVYDQACFEVVRQRGGLPAAIVPVDAATVRRAMLTSAEIDAGRRDAKRAGFVQIVDHKRVAEFEYNELAFGIRRPRTWLRSNGYGFPELEELVQVIIALLSADAHKMNDYTAGISTAGILAIKSKMNPQLFRAFRREFYSMLSGAENSRRTPIIQLDPENNEELQAINLQSGRDWQDYQQWTGYLLKVACAIFQIDAAELGFVFGTENQSASLNQGGPTQRIIASKEKGLRPLLRASQTWMNQWVIHQIDPDFELTFGGLNSQSENDKIDQEVKRVKAFMTVNEVRAKWDLEPLESEAANMILDSTYMNTAANMLQGEDEEGSEDQEPEEKNDLDSFFEEEKEEKEPEPEEEEEEEEEAEPEPEEDIEKGFKVVRVEVL